MAIQEGETVNFASDIRSCELAVIDPSAADHDTVVAIPQKMLATHRYIADAHLPFDIHVDKFFPNTGVLGPFQAESRKDEALATAGSGVGVVPVEIPQYSGTEADRVDAPSAYRNPDPGRQIAGDISGFGDAGGSADAEHRRRRRRS